MASELAVASLQKKAALVIRGDQERFDNAQIAALRQLGLTVFDQPTLDMYFLQCQRTGLDPFARQIYLIPRDGKCSIQTSIDGFRLIATRTGAYVGSDESWEFDTNRNVLSATVTVYRLVGGVRCPFSATAHYEEYVQMFRDKKTNKLVPNNMWQKYPARMLAKCAEAL